MLKKRARILAPVLLLLFVATTALAESGWRTLHFATPVVFSGTQLEPGTYRIHWRVDGAQADIKLIKGHKTAVETRCQLVKHPDKWDRTETLIRRESDGSMVITEIRLGNDRDSLILTPPAL